MLLRIGIENGVEGRSLAWALGYPGCFAYGRSGEEALDNLEFAIQEYIDWIASNDMQPWLNPTEPEIQVEETWEVYTIDEAYELAAEGYEVNAWFRFDWKALSEQEIERGLKLLAWSRAALLDSVRGLGQAGLETRYPGERWSIAGILKHVGGAEWWYLDRLSLAPPRQEVPETPFERLEMVRTHLEKALSGLAGSQQVVGIDGEFWSPRKLLRRAVWHERDHTLHIRKLLNP